MWSAFLVLLHEAFDCLLDQLLFEGDLLNVHCLRRPLDLVYSFYKLVVGKLSCRWALFDYRVVLVVADALKFVLLGVRESASHG